MRHSTFPMFDRLWELRHNLSTYDAAYVVLAETLDCGFLLLMRGSVKPRACTAR